MASPRFAAAPSFLLAQIGAVSAQRFAEAISPIGLHPRAFAVLANVMDLGPRTQQQLADELGMHRNNMVSLVDELESNGWARRVRSDTDRRAFRIELTARGRRIADRAQQTVPELDRQLTETLSAAERTTLATLLAKVADGVGLTPGVHPHLGARR